MPGKHLCNANTSWFGQEGGDLDTITTTGWDPGSVSVVRRSGVPRNVQKNTDRPLQLSQFLKSIDFVRSPPLPLRRSMVRKEYRFVTLVSCALVILIDDALDSAPAPAASGAVFPTDAKLAKT